LAKFSEKVVVSSSGVCASDVGREEKRREEKRKRVGKAGL
jgi:hypothetical protein